MTSETMTRTRPAMGNDHSMDSVRSTRRRGRAGFTLIEILSACAVLSILLSVLLTMTVEVQKTYRMTQGKSEQFRGARVAFEAITRRLSQATLNTYWDYAYGFNGTPSKYQRQSELRFRCGAAADFLPSGITTGTHAAFFQAPFGFTKDTANYGGMESLLNTWGYFIEFGDDSAFRPDLVNSVGVPKRNRFRLLEMMEPSEKLSVFKYTSGAPTYSGAAWYLDPLAQPNRSSCVLADNVIALILLPKDPDGTVLTNDYKYDSSPDAVVATQSLTEHQLPPNIQVTMVAIDEASAKRFAANAPGATAPDFGLASLFQQANSYEADLKSLREKLVSLRVSYRVFTSNVSLRGAKWSRN